MLHRRKSYDIIVAWQCPQNCLTSIGLLLLAWCVNKSPKLSFILLLYRSVSGALKWKTNLIQGTEHASVCYAVGNIVHITFGVQKYLLVEWGVYWATLQAANTHIRHAISAKNYLWRRHAADKTSTDGQCGTKRCTTSRMHSFHSLLQSSAKQNNTLFLFIFFLGGRGCFVCCLFSWLKLMVLLH